MLNKQTNEHIKKEQRFSGKEFYLCRNHVEFVCLRFYKPHLQDLHASRKNCLVRTTSFVYHIFVSFKGA